MSKVAFLSAAMAGTILYLPTPATADLLINLDGVRADFNLNNPANTIFAYDVGANTRIGSFDFNLILTSLGRHIWTDAWMTMYTSAGDGIDYRWEFGRGLHGRMRYNGSIDLEAAGAAFNVANDGRLFIQFYNSSLEWTDGVSTNYFNGSMTLRGIDGTLIDVPRDEAMAPTDLSPLAAVPEPATWMMMIVGVGGVGATMRRRRIAVSFA